MTPRPQLSIVVNQETGEVREGCPDCQIKDETIERLEDQVEGLKTRTAALAGQNTRIKREHAELDEVAPNHDQVLEVMAYWRLHICPGAQVTAGSKGWRTVKARLAERDAETGRQFTVLELKAAVVGLALDGWHMDRQRPHRRYLENAFADAGKVNRLMSRAVMFKRTYGVSALAILDDLGGQGLVWLAERCSCGHVRLRHVTAGPTPDGRQPCEDCDCPDYDRYAAMLERKWLELQQSDDPQDRIQVIEGERADRKGRRPS